MPKTDKNTIFYDLSLSQFIVHFGLTYSVHRQSMNIPVCLTITGEVDFGLMRRAVRTEIGRNDSLRLYFKKRGGKLMQYFLTPEEAEKLPLNIREADFTGKTREEQEAFLRKDASAPVRYAKGEIYRFIFFRTCDGRAGLYFAVCHLNMDAMSVYMTLRDLLGVYRALEGKAEMPKPFLPYTDYIAREKPVDSDPAVYKKNEKYYLDLFREGGEPVFCGPTGPELLEKLRKKRRRPACRSYPIFSLFGDGSDNVVCHIGPDFARRIDEFARARGVSPQALFLTALCRYISKVNGGADDITYTIASARRPSLADKTTFGCMASGTMLRTRLDPAAPFLAAAEKISGQSVRSYRYSHYPNKDCFRAVQKMYKLPPFDHYQSFMLSYLYLPNPESWDIDARWVSSGHFPTLLYAVVMNSLSGGGYDVTYEYRTSLFTPEQIKTLHAGMTEILRLGLENPESPAPEITAGTK